MTGDRHSSTRRSSAGSGTGGTGAGNPARSFREDRRAAAIQVGAVVLLGFVVIAIATYQAQVISQQNGEVEFEHQQEVRDRFSTLRDEVVGMADAPASDAVTVPLGTTYPGRTIFVNPPPVTGSLRSVGTTNASVNVTVENAEGTGELADFWNGTPRNYSTGAIVYRPEYHVREDYPVSIYENSVYYDRFRDRNVTQTDQRLIRGDLITLVALNGSLDRAGASAASVDLRPTTTAVRTVTVENVTATRPVTVTVPTFLNASQWQTLLADQSNVSSVSAAGRLGRYNRVAIELAPGTYRLRTLKVGIGNESVDERRAYVVDVRGNGSSVVTDGSQELVAEVRDRYDNPVTGIEVTASVVSPPGPNAGSISGSGTTTTDDRGRATFTYEAPSSTTTAQVEVTFAGGGGPPSAEQVATFDLEVVTAGGDDNAYSVAWGDPSGQTGTNPGSCTDASCTLDVTQASTLDLRAGTSPTAVGGRVEYSTNDSGLASLDPTVGETNATGENDTTLIARGVGTVAVYAQAGGDADTIRVTLDGGALWDGAEDWDRGTATGGVVHADVGTRSDDVLRLGYPATDEGGSNLLVYYPFDAIQSGQAVDATGNGRDGTVGGATVASTGVFNTSAYEFAGSQEYVNDTDAGTYLNGLTEFTISAWVQSNTYDVDTGIVYGQNPDGTDQPFGVRYDDAGYQSGCNACLKAGIETTADGERVYESASDAQTTNWQHVVVKWSAGSGMELFLNGTADAAAANESAGGEITDVSRLLVGLGAKAYGGAGGWDGRIDEVRVYGRELSDAEATALYEASQHGNHTTEWVTFQGGATDLQLRGVDADLNGGSVEVTVQADQDGDGDPDENQTVPISNQPNYNVPTFSTPAERYRLRIELRSPTPTDSPVFREVLLREAP